MTLNNGTWYLMFAALLFALSDIVNKKYVSQESNLSMLFYIALGTAVFAFLPAHFGWVSPTPHEYLLLFFLGAGGNLILFFLLKAFSATDVSALAPYRYTELFFAGFFGYLFYQEVPTFWTFVGTGIIIASTASIAYYEIYQNRQTKA
jgi:S-adenosylmethionine uptake transporter